MPYALNRKKKKADFSTRVCYFYLKKKKRSCRYLNLNCHEGHIGTFNKKIFDDSAPLLTKYSAVRGVDNLHAKQLFH